VGLIHSCALTKDGHVWCWGSNGYGQLGNGKGGGLAHEVEPVEVWKLKDVTSITAGERHTCARTGGFAVKCWGDNSYGQLGDGTTERRLLPVTVRGLTGIAVHVAAGAFHTCVVTVEGAAKCWGRNLFGQLGDGTTLDRVKPRSVITLRSDVTAITAGMSHTCALKGARAKCWGSNGAGQLGDGTKTNRLIPVNVIGFR